jgi:bifunctional diaminopimelate decarboxylase / aspartate kinase
VAKPPARTAGAGDAPRYVYSCRPCAARASSSTRCRRVDRRFFAIKANPHPRSCARWSEEGFGLECVSMAALDAALTEVKALYPRFELWIEPGRYLVAEAGVVLTRVTQVKRKGQTRFVGVDAGMHTLIRPALYEAWHEIVHLAALAEPGQERMQVVGPICESGDVLGEDRLLPPCAEDDVLLIANAGAYGAAMASRYNLRGLPVEVYRDDL